MNQHRRKLELLAPAGDRAAMKAAVANGADAVYFGLRQFSARARAANFSVEELPEVLAALHGNNVRGYVAFNTLVFSNELDRAAGQIEAIARAGADAVIVQDLGVARLVHRMAPSLAIHASTQMTLAEGRSIAVVKSLGVTRVILPRELSLDDIARIAASTDLELEVFAHGAMCISFSGQCAASQSLFSRSGNRGLCAQACRLPYQLIVDGKAVRDSRRFNLSPGDLAAHDLVDQLMRAGVHGIKIEGRLKSEHYVAAACGVYRKAIDTAATAGKFSLSRREELALAQGFSRGFTHGFLRGADHGRLVEGISPKSRGLLVGKVVRVSPKAVIVQLAGGVERPNRGDGVVFDRPALWRDERDVPGGRIYSVRAAAGARSGGSLVELEFDNDLELAKISSGDEVWKTDDPQVRRELEATFARVETARPSRVDVRVEAAPDSRLKIEFIDDRGHRASGESDQPLPRATSHPLTVGLLREQLGRLGGTPFELGTVELVADGGAAAESVDVLAPKSVLNQLRRRLVERLIELRGQEAIHPVVEAGALAALRADARGELTGREAQASGAAVHMHVLVRTAGQVEAVVSEMANISASARAGLVYLDLPDEEIAPAMEICRSANVSAALATPRVIRPGQEGLLDAIAARKPGAVLARNLGAIGYFRERLPEAAIIADAGLNVANELSAGFLAGQGALRLTPAYDLSEEDLEAMLAIAGGERFEAVVYQRVPMFHMAHCVFARLSGSSSCHQCSRPCRQHDLRLRDRNGVDHPVRVDAANCNTVFRGESESHFERIARLVELGVRHFRIELLDEPAQECGRLVAQAAGKMTNDECRMTKQ